MLYPQINNAVIKRNAMDTTYILGEQCVVVQSRNINWDVLDGLEHLSNLISRSVITCVNLNVMCSENINNLTTMSIVDFCFSALTMSEA